ncbi:hypothetical protein [Nonomuraea sp. NPDC050786]|uniref:hypothetical protein n=1 Tax=Nonomuraea sp. NPDC050786 TaxID=3154840 RepID=UPI0033FEBD5A
MSYIWEPHTPRGLRCVAEASCCEAFILCFESAEFYVLRRTEDGKEEETVRGTYEQALAAWQNLDSHHQRETHQVAS